MKAVNLTTGREVDATPAGHQVTNMKYTDTRLKQALAKMLPDTVGIYKSITSIEGDRDQFLWLDTDCGRTVYSNRKVLDTELLHLCWLVEETVTEQWSQYEDALYNIPDIWEITHATWQQRVVALAKVKGIEI